MVSEAAGSHWAVEIGGVNSAFVEQFHDLGDGR
jgi:hypothetical protein